MRRISVYLGAAPILILIVAVCYFLIQSEPLPEPGGTSVSTWQTAIPQTDNSALVLGSTDVPLPPDTPSHTPANTLTATVVFTVTPTDTPTATPTFTFTFTPTETPSPTATPSSPYKLTLFRAGQDFFVIFIASSEPLSVNGLQFAYFASSGGLLGFEVFTDFVGALHDGVADPGSCFVYRYDLGAEPGADLPDVCLPDRTYEVARTAAEVFWFDFLTGQARDIALYRSGVPTGQRCPGNTAVCDVTFIAPRARQ